MIPTTDISPYTHKELTAAAGWRNRRHHGHGVVITSLLLTPRLAFERGQPGGEAQRQDAGAANASDDGGATGPPGSAKGCQQQRLEAVACTRAAAAAGGMQQAQNYCTARPTR